MNLLLKNLSWIQDNIEYTGDLRIAGDRIIEIDLQLLPARNEKTLDFQNHFAYRGLINAHDHLEMNLYPKLGQPPYNNYIDWARDIFRPEESPVKEIQRVDLADRLSWGCCKNLLSGVTTVIHHNDFYKSVFRKNFPISVFEDYEWAHSLAFEKNVRTKYRADKKFIIHAAEGVDKIAYEEIDRLVEWGILKSNTVIVHGVALNDRHIETLAKAGSALVWCPSSNDYLFRQTAPVNTLKNKIPVMLGTDSTLTGSATLFEEMQTALNTGFVTAKEIYEMVTYTPARVFGLSTSLTKGNLADIMVMPRHYDNYYENLVMSNSADISLLLSRGEPQLIGVDSAKTLDSIPNAFIHQTPKWIGCDITRLKKQIEKDVDTSILIRNPLWNLINAVIHA